MSKVRTVQFDARGRNVSEVEAHARQQADEIADGREYSLHIGPMKPQARENGRVMWAVDVEVTFDYGDKTVAAAPRHPPTAQFPSGILRASDPRQFSSDAGGQVTP